MSFKRIVIGYAFIIYMALFQLYLMCYCMAGLLSEDKENEMLKEFKKEKDLVILISIILFALYLMLIR